MFHTDPNPSMHNITHIKAANTQIRTAKQHAMDRQDTLGH